MKKSCFLLVLLPAVVIMNGCAASKSANPLSPTVAGPIPGVNISAPLAVQPKDNAKIAVDQQPLTLMLENAATSGSRPLTYVFEVATDSEFTNKVYTRDGIAPGDSGRTGLRLADPLESGRTYYWHARAQDGANTGPYSGIAFFTVFTPVVIGAAVPISPINDVVTSTTHPTFVIGNAPRSGPVGAIGYTIEVANSDSFVNKVVWTLPEQPSQSTLVAPVDGPYNTRLFWHVMASDGANAGPWSSTQTFRTPAPPVVVVPPPPSGGGGGGGAACGSLTSPLAIVQCERAKYGMLIGSTQVNFIKAVAKDLNTAGIAGGPFGVLRKASGSSCSGYSCDIICTGQGSSQKQWDVLIDSDGDAVPMWSGPNTSGIRVDTCEIQ